jgi:hypothetical protein
MSASPSNIYDLTGWLEDGSAIHVQKSVRDPAGAFSITFSDKLDGGLSDSLYTLIEPMDLIEIRFAGDAYKYALSQSNQSGQNQLPIAMRGFVSSVDRAQSMDSEGRPRRAVEVQGHDYGKLLQQIQIFNLPPGPDSANLITTFPFFSKFGFVNIDDSTTFIETVFSQVVNAYIANMQTAVSASAAALLEVAVDVQTPAAAVSVQLGAFSAGNLQQFVETYLDVGAFNEFFIEDRDQGAWGPAGPYAVYRPVPYLDAVTRKPLAVFASSVTTGVLQTSATAPVANCTAIKSDSIISISARRSDQSVANYFLVDAPRFNLNYDPIQRQMALWSAANAAQQPYYVTDYGNVNPLVYGTRKMEVSTQQGGVTETNNGNGTPNGEARWANQQSFMNWITDRRNLLIAVNRDNVVLESGTMRLKGNENIRAGSYIQINYGATPANPAGTLQSLYYAQSVTHVFEPFGNYFTEVEFIRGTNFIDRTTQMAGGASPYWMEMVQSNGV